MTRRSTRADDERLLLWLSERQRGLTSGFIATRHGTTPEAIRVATNRVRKHDEELSQDCPKDIAAGYW